MQPAWKPPRGLVPLAFFGIVLTWPGVGQSAESPPRFSGGGEVQPLLAGRDARFAATADVRFLPQVTSKGGRFTVYPTKTSLGGCDPTPPQLLFADGFEPLPAQPNP